MRATTTFNKLTRAALVLALLLTPAMLATAQDKAQQPKAESKQAGGDKADIEAKLRELKKREDLLRERLKALKREIKAVDELVNREPADSPSPSPQQHATCVKPERGEQLSKLTRRLRAMRPERAAMVMASLKSELAADVLVNLDARNSGRILDHMSPQVAASLGELIVNRAKAAGD